MNNAATLTVTNFAAGVDTFRIGTGNLSGAQLAQFIFATANGNWTGTGGGGTWQAGRMGSFGLTNAAAQNDGSGYISAVNAYNTAVAFGGTAETVTVSGTVQAGSLGFASGGFDLQGGTIQLNGSGVAVTGANTIGSVIAGTNGLSKTGTGTLTLSGNNAYTGATTIGGGTLLVATNGSIASSSLATVNSGGLLQVNGTAGAITVNNGGSLGGSGSVGAVTLTTGSHLKPGNSPGTLTAASAIVLGGSTYNWQISALEGTAGTNWDLLSVTGLLNMSGVTSENRWNLVVTADGGFTGWTGTSEYSYVFAQAANLSLLAGFSTDVGTDVTSLFNITTSGFASTSLPNYQFNAAGDFKVVVGRGAGDLTTLKLMAIPEPSTGSMLGFGLAGLVVTRLFRRKGV
jgi:autotransporter-associated beta strand protein